MTTESKHIIQPYLMFGGRCEEAVEFYREQLGAQVQAMLRFEESPEPPPEGMLPDGYGKKIMHAAFRIGDSLLMASDGCGDVEKISGISLSLTLPDEAAVDRAFAALSEGGKINMPLGETFWSPRFGMVEDKFGVSWMVGVWTPCPEA
ncbi:VOC family protein [Luteolibacter sp. SL250]|uniref:VOC family protein n=1 Tax=Luteolibacter sp. SL250 TaxID=2995170 RepID=UPI00226E85E3|nr:VOC family protein [Luteolibacter sp. SL250]WAC19600.1 VOC family protein [Luteolibacter sp. SL250]